MTGRKEYKDVLYLIDFGLSKKYIDLKTGEHVKYKNNHRLNGTARFASVHALEGYELSRRDDLESICYVLIYLLKGSLPWSRIKNKNKYEKYKIILTMKRKMSEDILIGDNNNQEFIEFVKYCRGLKFEEEPDYNYLRGLMIKSIEKNNKIKDNLGKYIKNDIFENSFCNISQNKIDRNKRTCSMKKIRNNLVVSNKLLNANKRNEITDFDNKKINETKSGTLAYIGKKVRNYSSYKKNDLKEFPRLLELKKKQKEKNESNNSSENEANNIKFIDVKCLKDKPNNNNTNKKKNNNNKNNNNNDYITNLKVINKNKTIYKDNASTASSTNENKKYSLTKLDLIKKGLGIEPRKAQIREDINIENNDGENKDDGCIIL